MTLLTAGDCGDGKGCGDARGQAAAGDRAPGVTTALAVTARRGGH